jgi:hypothetical protein
MVQSEIWPPTRCLQIRPLPHLRIHNAGGSSVTGQHSPKIWFGLLASLTLARHMSNTQA